MRGIRSTFARILTMLLALMMFVAVLPTACAANETQERISYYYYLQQHTDAIHPDVPVSVDVAAFDAPVSESVLQYHDREGSAEGIEITAWCHEVSFEIDVLQSGLYALEMTYMALPTTDRKIMFGLMIDGQYPFTEALNCVVDRVYRNTEITQDGEGNDIRPYAQQQAQWRSQYVKDLTGINGALSFYLEEGKHSVTLTFEECDLLVERMEFKQIPYTESYQDYIVLNHLSEHHETQGVLEIVQAEVYEQQSSSTLWPVSDRSSSLTQPFDYKLTRINVGGGSQWKTPGDWISWKVVVPEDGFYQIGFKYKQGYLDGLFSSRKLYIDGVVPFEQLSDIRFDYAPQWENLVLGNGGEPYSIYLTAGEHVLTLENVLGDIEDTISVMQNCVNDLNELYLSIIMITGSEPDKYRDYYLSSLLPNLEGDLREIAQMLFDEAERLIQVVGEKGKETAYFESIAYNLVSYADNIMDLTFKSRVTNLKNDISSLSAKMLEYQQQALDIDYIVVKSADMDMPRVKMNAAEWVEYQAKSIAATFEPDEEVEASVLVWMGGGNTQFEIVQRMIDDMFTPQTGIKVDLVLGGTGVINAVLSGVSPDVMMNGGDIVDLALRGGLERLDTYPGYEEVMSEYVPGINIPNTLDGGVYAIQTVGSFNMMFVRTDIFEQLGLEIPQTWDDVLDISQVLQRNNMNLGIVPTFETLLYQMGGEYYNADLTQVAFSEKVAVDAFRKRTDFYTKYGFPISFNFLTQFRTGEMPIAMATYDNYNSVRFSAPEINGLWEMYPLPGTMREDGTIDYTQASGGSGGVVIPANATNKEGAWEFIKWWCSAEAQERYGKDLEAALGISARYNSMNLNVLPKLGWTQEEYKVLSEAIAELRFTPVVPGDYYITRGITNTFQGIVNDGENVRELLNEWTKKINEEITRKRREFYLVD